MGRKRKINLAPEQIGVKTVPTAQLHPNPHNPRFLFDKEPMKTLEESIKKVGILVPLTIYQRGSDGKFIILDGQRRWMCAQGLKLPEVPVNQVAEPDLVQNIVTMFQIHKLRRDWELMPTALKVEVLMDKMEEKSDRKLAELTGLDLAVVTRCKKLLSFSREFQELMLDPNEESRVKADFFIELYPVLHDRIVRGLSDLDEEQIVQKMLEKHQSKQGGIKAVTDFRKVKQYLSNARKAGKVTAVSKKFREFVGRIELGPEHLAIASASVASSARSLHREIEKITKTLTTLDVEEYGGEEDLWKAIESLLRVIRKCLAKAERRVEA